MRQLSKRPAAAALMIKAIAKSGIVKLAKTWSILSK